MSLTDDFKKGKLRFHNSYYCQDESGKITIATVFGFSEDILFSSELNATLSREKWKVLDPCDYEKLQQLRGLLRECRTLCKEMIEVSRLYKQGKSICPCEENIIELSTRIDTIIGESEE